VTQLDDTSPFRTQAGSLAPSEPDEDLLALPAPPRGLRLLSMTLMAAVVVLAMAFAVSLRSDLAYFFASQQPTALGDATALVPADLAPNEYVTVRGTPMLSGTVRFAQTLGAGEFVVFPLAGQRDLFVQVPASDFDGVGAARSEFAGRLVTFGSLGVRFRSVRDYLAGMNMPVTSETFLVVADESPSSHVWVLAMLAICLGIVILNIWLMLRWFRPISPASG
jgi:hypothetical protein